MAFGKGVKDEALVCDSFEQLLGILADERRKYQRRWRYVAYSVVSYFIFVALITWVLHLIHVNSDVVNGLLNGISTVIITTLAVSQTQSRAMQALAQFDDIRAIPCLIEALEYNDPAMQAVANKQLPLLLARMQASDAPLLTKEHHALLNKVLKLKVPRKKRSLCTFKLPFCRHCSKSVTNALCLL